MIVFKTNGTIFGVEAELDSTKRLEQLQQLVGGFIEICPTHVPGLLMVINEGGKLQRLPMNPVATGCYGYNKPEELTDIIMGDAVLASEKELGDEE